MYRKYRDSLFNIRYSYRGKKYRDVPVPGVSLQAYSQLRTRYNHNLRELQNRLQL